MAKRNLFLTSLLLTVTMAFGQDFSRHSADSMIKAMKKIRPGNDRIELLLNLAQYYIFKPGEDQKDFDSAMVYIREASDLTNSNKSSIAYGYQLLTESYLYRESGQRERGKKMAEEAVRILESGTNKKFLGQAYAELAKYYGNLSDSVELSKRITLIQQSIDAFQQAWDLLAKARNLELLGDLYSIKDDNKAIPTLKKALATYDSIKFPETQGVYVLLGNAYVNQEDYGQALFYLLKALKIVQMQHIYSGQVCQINNTLGILYHSVGRCDVEVKYINDGLEIARKNNHEDAILVLATNAAGAYCDLEQPGKSIAVLDSIPRKLLESSSRLQKVMVELLYFKNYVLLQQFTNAQAYCDPLLKVADSNLVRDMTTSAIYRALAIYHFSIKNYLKSRYYLTKSFKKGKANYERAYMQNLRLQYMLDSAQGNFQAAFDHLHFYKTKIDSFTSERKTRQFQVLTVEYEVGLKEDSIKLKEKDIVLLKQENSLQQANLKQASIIKNVTIAGIILAFVIIGLLYRQYRHKQKSNRVITQKNEQLQHYLDEKEWLLKEIHHRVKNNLQIVMSLLNSQTAYIESEPALTAIHDSQHRIHAMSLIHQKLYNTENLSSINISTYIRELVSYLADSFNTGQRIHFEFAVEPLEMDVSQAVPLGLILNEAITNSIKYAFPGDRIGIISISLSNTSPHQYLLVITDNGIGMPPNFTGKKHGSLGMSLMEGLSEDLDGHFCIESNNGTTIKIAFKKEMSVMRNNTLTASLNSHN